MDGYGAVVNVMNGVNEMECSGEIILVCTVHTVGRLRCGNGRRGGEMIEILVIWANPLDFMFMIMSRRMMKYVFYLFNFVDLFCSDYTRAFMLLMLS